MPDRFWTVKDNNVTFLKVMFDSMETLFNQFAVLFKLAETVSKVVFGDQNEELMLFKQAAQHSLSKKYSKQFC